ncbi:MAG TPA: PAAR domain-containing protein [Candidatus Elarobacter sp.]|jgi:uncharacterized Zn-binding protein involved in type VI secretion
MGQPAAKLGDRVVGLDNHIVLVPGPDVPVPVAFAFDGIIDGGCSSNVTINGRPAAMLGSTATNEPPHISPSGPFVIPPTNKATIVNGSAFVRINGRPAARAGDAADTCNDVGPLPVGKVVASSTVLIG